MEPDERELEVRAFEHYLRNELEVATELYLDLVERSPLDARYHYYLGNCLAKRGNTEQAIRCWKRVVLIDPLTSLGRRAAARCDRSSRLQGRAKASDA